MVSRCSGRLPIPGSASFWWFFCFVLFFSNSHHGFPNSPWTWVPASLARLTLPPLPPSPIPMGDLRWVPPAHLPKLQICSSLSRWLRAETRKPPPSVLPPSPPFSGLSRKCRCLIMHFTDREGPRRGEPPPTNSGSKTTWQGAAGRCTATHGDCFSSTSHIPYLFLFLFSFSFSWKRKAVSGQRLARACLGVRAGCGTLSCQERKGREGNIPPPAFSVHALCHFLQRHPPTPFF